MKLHDYHPVPNPRRVRIFLAEKGLTLETVEVDLTKGAHLAPAFRAINPRRTVPVLELDDGTCIAEVPAICGYIEDLHPEPPLMGRDARDRAIVAMWDRRMEIDGYLAAADAVRNTLERMAHRALPGPHNYEQIPALAERSRLRIANLQRDLEARLAESPFVAGESFTIADITAFVTLDFAAKRIGLVVPEECAALRRWQAGIAARPSAAA